MGWSTVLVYHATFCINSLAHVHGRKRYVTGDHCRNSWLLAFFTLARDALIHDAYQSSIRQGFRWWEIDVTFYALKALSMVASLGPESPPVEVLRNEQRLGSRVVNRADERLVARLNPERIAHTVSSVLHSSELSALLDALGQARSQTADGLALLQSRMPSREEMLAHAQVMFVRTRFSSTKSSIKLTSSCSERSSSQLTAPAAARAPPYLRCCGATLRKSRKTGQRECESSSGSGRRSRRDRGGYVQNLSRIHHATCFGFRLPLLIESSSIFSVHLADHAIPAMWWCAVVCRRIQTCKAPASRFCA